MPALPKRVKQFAVRCAAQFDTPAEVARAVKAEFDLDMSRQQAALYDPTHRQGRKLGIELRALFDSTRKQFLDELEELPLAHRAVRLRKLGLLYERADEQGNLKAALGAVALAQKEMAVFEFVEVPEGDTDAWDSQP